MTAPRAILLVPTEAGAALLAGVDGRGAHGAYPPSVARCGCGMWGHLGCAGWLHGSGRALPLWWDGALVPEGWDRFVRVLLIALGDQDDYPVSRWPTVDGVLNAASAATSLCRVVLLDLVDGRLAERAP